MRDRSNPPPKVLLAILAKQKEPLLPLYLQCIEALDYPKSAMALYVRTNNNTDRTTGILREWFERVSPRYSRAEMDDSDVAEPVQQYGVHEWNGMRFRVLGRIRQASLEKALTWGCDYYFVSDVDNFLRPHTLRDLVSLQLPIVAPFLRHVEVANPYSNYHYEVDANGYYRDCEQYYWLHQQQIRGVFEVKVVHCTYLVRHDVIPRLAYADATDRHEYVIFSDRARRQGVVQYLDNRCIYGYLTLDESVAGAKTLLGADVAAALAARGRR